MAEATKRGGEGDSDTQNLAPVPSPDVVGVKK